MKGFTLIELLAVLVITAMLLAVSVPRFGSEIMAKLAARSEAREISAHILHARSRAITTSKRHKIRFLPSESPFTRLEILQEEEDGSWTELIEERISEKCTVTGQSEFTFESLGNPVSGGQLVVSRGERSFVIEVNPVIGSVEVREQ